MKLNIIRDLISLVMMIGNIKWLNGEKNIELQNLNQMNYVKAIEKLIPLF